MPKKRGPAQHCPISIREHLKWWGVEIRSHRILQRVTAIELGRRVGVSHPTIGRMEKGDPGISVSSYLSAIYSLGLTYLLTPEPTDEQKNYDPLSTRASSESDPFGEDIGYF